MTEEQRRSEPVEVDATDASTPPRGVGRIVVGVDGSAGSLTALAWAVTETRLRGSSLHVVMAWQRPPSIGSANVWGMGIDPSRHDQSLMASATADEASRLAAEAVRVEVVPVSSEAIEGHPAGVLLSASNDADLLVVGARGHGGFAGALLGSVSQHVVTHARCPVVVIPGARH
jgi:nucleotide-binding universal stress UspA family protein